MGCRFAGFSSASKGIGPMQRGSQFSRLACAAFCAALMGLGVATAVFAEGEAPKLNVGGVDGKGATVPLASLAGAAGVLELALGLLIMCGWFTRMAAFLASGEMAVAYFIGHQAQGFWPLQNGGEVAVLYCFAFLYIAAYGSGIWSIDSARK